jgi:hypothetical protein
MTCLPASQRTVQNGEKQRKKITFLKCGNIFDILHVCVIHLIYT